MEDFQKYPWDEVPDIYFRETLDYFRVFKEALPAGVKALGGVGNGVFECVQDLTGFTNLCYISADDPELYAALFRKVGELIYKIWERFLPEFSGVYAVSRFGDDLGYKSATMLTPGDVRQYIIPEYKRIIELIHAYGKPFMFHSCGNIFEVMDDIIDVAKIDAKHSNEDIIAPFPEWIERYGDRIGNFGGLDVDVLCGGDDAKIREQAAALVQNYGRGHGGLAVGSGNSIAHYVPVDSYVAMVEAVRMARGE
jgi:uroporphyrinogen decarboxylase